MKAPQMKRPIAATLAMLIALSSASCAAGLRKENDTSAQTDAVTVEPPAETEKIPTDKPSDPPVTEDEPETEIITPPANSETLDFVLREDGSYEVVGIGTYTNPELIIPTTYEGREVTRIGEDAFKDCKLTAVTIPDSVTEIGSGAFWRCSELASVTMGDGVMGIGDQAFGYCDRLTSVTLGKGVVSIGNEAFQSCARLESVTIPHSVTEIGGSAFAACSKLTDIHYDGTESQWNAIAKGDDWSHDVPDHAVHWVEAPETEPHVHAYGEWTVVVEASCETDGVQARYCDCGAEERDVLPATGHSYATSITPPTATEDGYTEYWCSACGESYTEDITAKSLSITSGKREWVGYTGTFGEKLVIPAVFEKDGTWYRVTSIGNSAFSSCGRLTSVIIPDSVTSIGSDAFRSCGILTSVTIPDGVKSIGSWAFQGCSSLTSVTIGDGVTSIGQSVFADCRRLTSVTIPDSVTSIGESAFRECHSLTSVTFGTSVTSIGNSAFYGCSSLASVTIPDSVTSIGDGAFYWCHRLTSVTIPDSVTRIGADAFAGCSSLTSVTIPDSVTSISESPFRSCSSLTEFIVDEGNQYYTAQDGVLYSKDMTALVCCPGGKSTVNIPDSVTSIGGRPFRECRSLTSVTIGSGVTSIGDHAFYYCDSLTSVTIGSGVTSIGGSAFRDCSSLTAINYTGTESQWNAINKGYDWDYQAGTNVGGYTVHYGGEDDAPVVDNLAIPQEQWVISGYVPYVVTSDQSNYSGMLNAAGVESAALLHQGSIGLGEIDLSLYSKVIIYWGSDASGVTVSAYNANANNRFMLVSADKNMTMSPDESTVIAAATYQLHGWNLAAIEIDLTDVDYSGPVFLTHDTLSGSFALIHSVEFVR